MTREEIGYLALNEIDRNKYLILELITGYGKTKIAIDLANHICDRVFRDNQCSANILILVDRRVQKTTWKEEIQKWGGIKSDSITMACYKSIGKFKDRYFDVVIADEMQHLSARALKCLEKIHIMEAFIGLSATISKDLRNYFKYQHKAEIITCGLKKAVDDGVLPEPIIYLIPLRLNNKIRRYKAKRFGKPVVLTQEEYYGNMDGLIHWYKSKFMDTNSVKMKRLWLSAAGKRLKWLSEQKEYLVQALLDRFKDCRTLTFCSSIDQSERLGKYNITSKNKNSDRNLELFNKGKIDHITSCNMLNESVNLVDCRIGIFCNLSSSRIVVRQRMGRLLRHKDPIMIIPFFVHTREEELLYLILEEYKKESVKVVNKIEDIKL